MDLRKALPDAWRIFFNGRTLREVQSRAMPAIVRGASVILSGPTASGKTEAALAPLYQRHVSFRRQHLSVVYVAPTRALVNDMYERLMVYFGATSPDVIQRYTGDHHGFAGPEGRFLLLATPEALDSLQLMKPGWLADVRAFVLDELHLLHATARGQQLRSVAARIRSALRAPADSRDVFQTVAMTATLRDAADVGQVWCGPDVQVLEVAGGRPIEQEVIVVAGEAAGIELANRIDGLARAGKSPKVLAFANSRNGGHRLAAQLAERLQDTRIPVHFHSGVLSKAEREHVEEAMRKDRHGICVATSTLEVGIDIGDVDIVVLAQPPHTVSAYLQRIGRGNRRSERCVVWAFAADEEEHQLYMCLHHCAERGDVDDQHDYHRPSVDFQQVLSVVWRGMRTGKAVTRDGVVGQAFGETSLEAIQDMLLTGVLHERRGALVLSDEWVDVCDQRGMHTVIVGAAATSLVDVNTGDVLGVGGGEMRDGGLVYTGSGMRAIKGADDAGIYLGSKVRPRTGDLAKLPQSRQRGPGLSRQVVWAMAALRGEDPTVWRLRGDTLVTWGGERFNSLLAAVLRASGHPKGLKSSAVALQGVTTVDVSPPVLADLAARVQERRLIPVKTANRFVEQTRFFGDMSPSLASEEAQRALPFPGLLRWLKQCRLDITRRRES